jgi:protein-disulfide isomerase
MMVIGGVLILAAAIGLRVASDNAIQLVIPEAREHPLADMNAIGDPNAPVTVEVYSSFGCSHCYYFFSESEELFIQNYVNTGLVYYIYQPFDSDPTSIYTTASNAAMCAGEQGKFWEMHDIIFSNARNGYVRSTLDDMAEHYDLDMEAFDTCVDSSRYVDQIFQTTNDAVQTLGVTGTPTFVVNGEIGMVGNEGYDALAAAVNEALAAVEGQ